MSNNWALPSSHASSSWITNKRNIEHKLKLYRYVCLGETGASHHRPLARRCYLQLRLRAKAIFVEFASAGHNTDTPNTMSATRKCHWLSSGFHSWNPWHFRYQASVGPLMRDSGKGLFSAWDAGHFGATDGRNDGRRAHERARGGDRCVEFVMPTSTSN